MPLLKAAKKALDTLDNSILAEIKTIKKDPPAFVRCILYAISLVLFNKMPKDWSYVIKNVMNMQMKNNMCKMSPEKLKQSQYNKIKKHL